MAVSFSQIPADRRMPGAYAEISSSRAQRGLQGMPQRALLVGQRHAGGSSLQHVPHLITDPDQADELFGRASMLHQMATAFLDNNDTTELWCIALNDDVAGTASVQTVTIGKSDGGEDFGAGTLNLWVGGERIRVAVQPDDTAAEVVTALVTQSARQKNLPATFAADGVTAEQLNITARHKGAAAGAIDVRINYHSDERTPRNMTVAIATETAGAGDPEIAGALAAVDGQWWTQVAMPYLDGTNYAALHDWLSARFDALDMRDGIGFAVRSGTFAELVTAGEAVNSQFIVTPPVEKSPSVAWTLAAGLAGLAAEAAEVDPARQLRTLEVRGWLPPAPEDRFTVGERELLLRSGISAMDFDTGAARIARLITNYQLSPAGAEDTAYLDLTTLTTLAYLRWSETRRIELRFPRHKLASDDTKFGARQAIATPQIVRGELIALYREWEDAGLVENSAFFIERLIVERDGGDPNRLNSLQTPDLINNFRVFAALIQFRL